MSFTVAFLIGAVGGNSCSCSSSTSSPYSSLITGSVISGTPSWSTPWPTYKSVDVLVAFGANGILSKALNISSFCFVDNVDSTAICLIILSTNTSPSGFLWSSFGCVDASGFGASIVNSSFTPVFGSLIGKGFTSPAVLGLSSLSNPSSGVGSAGASGLTGGIPPIPPNGFAPACCSFCSFLDSSQSLSSSCIFNFL